MKKFRETDQVKLPHHRKCCWD